MPARAEKNVSRQGRNRIKAVAIISGLLGFILFCATPFMPVKQVQSSYSWPQGDDLTSVTSPLMSYSPESLDITLPVKEIRHLNPGQTTVLSTVPDQAEDATLRGMLVRSTDDGMDVIVRNVVPLSIDKEELKKLPDDAKLHISSNHESTRVWVPDAKDSHGRPFDSTIQSDIRPMLTGIYSELKTSPQDTQAAKAAGLDVNVKVDSRFTSSPTIAKYLTMWLGVLCTIIALWALHRIDMLDGRPGRGRMLQRGWWKPRWLDAVVGGVLLFWYFLGANTADDGYLLTMARASNSSTYMANYFRWFGVPESPFGAPYYDLLGVMSQISTASTFMRLPSLIAGLVTWLILSREVMPRLGTKINHRRVAHWTMAAVFLIFWMTYNNGTRPEPVIAVLAILTWVSFERAIATRRLLPAAIGTILAALALGAGPTGLMAVTAMLVSISSLIRIAIRRLPALDAAKGSSKFSIFTGLLAQVAPFLAAGTAILTAVFGDQTFRTVREAIAVRSDRGPALNWYEEYLRYTALLEQTVDGSFPRRFAVLMMFFCFGVVIASMLRNGRVPGVAKGPSTRLVLIILGTMFFMTFTPTKWTHHFGVYAGIGAALAGVAAVAASHIALRSRRNRILFFGATLGLFAFTLSGTNGWWYISSFGVPWWDKTIQVAGIEASTVMLMVALAVLLWGVLVGFFTDAKQARASSEEEVDRMKAQERSRLRRFNGVFSAPIAVITAIVVVASMGSMAKGFLSQWPAYSVGKGNLSNLKGNACAMASDVMVETNTNQALLPVASGGKLKDSLTEGGGEGFEPNNVPTRIKPGGDNQSSSGGQTSVNSQNKSGAGSQGSSNAGSQGSGSDSSSTSNSSSSNASGSNGSDNSNSSSGSGTGKDDSSSDSSTSSNDVNDSGTTGGLESEVGINGSFAKLPFGLDNKEVPVVGSFTEGLQRPAHTMTSWYKLPARDEQHPLVVFSAAGQIGHFDMNGVWQYGQELMVEFGKDDGKGGFQKVGEYLPLDIGTGPEWRNMRVPMSDIPEDATSLRIRATDTNLTPDQWLAFTPPRAPEMQSLNDYVGSQAPTLLDWSAAFQFPCQRPYSHYAGVAEVPEFRISPDHSARRAHTPVMDYYGGGSAGLVEMTTQSDELPTYLANDWQRDWGVLDHLTTFPDAEGKSPKPVSLNEETVTRSGNWYNGPMKYKD